MSTAAAPDFAQALRLAREARGWSIDEAAQRCLLSDVQVRGLEAADHQAFYSRNYVTQAAVRYAALLQVETSLQGFPAAAGAPLPLLRPAHQSADSGPAEHKARVPWRWALGGVAGLGLIMLVAYLLAGRGEEAVMAEPPVAQAGAQTAAPPPPPPPAVPQSAPEPEAAPVAQPSPVVPVLPETEPVPAPAPTEAKAGVTTERGRSPLRFHVHALNAVRFRATDSTGAVVFAGTLAADKRLNLTGRPPFTVEAAAGDDLEVFYLGQRKRFGPAANGTPKILFGDPSTTP